MINTNDILKYFPNNVINSINELIIKNNIDINNLEEIRIRINKPIILKIRQADFCLDYNPTSDELLYILQNMCDNSIYSFQNQICNGFITIKGGHRVGITGNVVIKDNKVINISYISSLNFRIAKQIIGVSEKIINYVIDYKNNNVYNTLIVSSPGVRKNNNIKRFS